MLCSVWRVGKTCDLSKGGHCTNDESLQFKRGEPSSFLVQTEGYSWAGTRTKPSNSCLIMCSFITLCLMPQVWSVSLTGAIFLFSMKSLYKEALHNFNSKHNIVCDYFTRVLCRTSPFLDVFFIVLLFFVWLCYVFWVAVYIFRFPWKTVLYVSARNRKPFWWSQLCVWLTLWPEGHWSKRHDSAQATQFIFLVCSLFFFFLLRRHS